MFEILDTTPLSHARGSVWRAIRESPGKFLFQGILGTGLLIVGTALLFGSLNNWALMLTGTTLTGVSGNVGDQAGAVIAAIMLLFFATITIGAGSYLFGQFFSRSFARARAMRFAAHNGLQYRGDQPGPRYQATVFLIPADHRRHRDVVIGKIGEHTLEFGDFLATTEQKRANSSTTRTQTVARFGYLAMNLTARGPKFILDSRQDGNLRGSFAGHSRYDLEGDFPDHFTAWVPHGTERDMLEMLTPDVMARFSDHGQDFDFEVCGNLLVLIAKRRSTTKAATVTGMLAAAEQLVPILNAKAKQGSW